MGVEARGPPGPPVLVPGITYIGDKPAVRPTAQCNNTLQYRQFAAVKVSHHLIMSGLWWRVGYEPDNIAYRMVGIGAILMPERKLDSTQAGYAAPCKPRLLGPRKSPPPYVLSSNPAKPKPAGRSRSNAGGRRAASYDDGTGTHRNL